MAPGLAAVDKPTLRVFDADQAAHDPIQARVLDLYTGMHTHQTVAFVEHQHRKWTALDHGKYTALEALDLLSTFVDQSDPDVDFSNDNHAYQSAEAARAAHPDNEWLQVVCLVHDMGKIMSKWGQPQWATVGDTFVVGCAPGEHVAHRHTFKNNPDMLDSRYNTKLGVYTANCGFDNVTMSWGHDEYLYHVLRNHPGNKLPVEAMYMVRYHSFYPWHDCGDYDYLANEHDRKMLEQLHLFNQFDLYSKCSDLPSMEELKPYYAKLLDKWLPGEIAF